MKAQGWPVAVFAAAIFLEIVLLVKLLEAGGTPTQLLGAIVAVFAVMAIVPRLSDLETLKLPGGIEAKLREVSSELADAKSDIANTKSVVQKTSEQVEMLFALSLAPWQHYNLQKLASGRFGPYVMSLGLENDLRHLRNHGYIKVPSVRDLPKTGEELSRYVTVTETGRQLLSLREELGISTPDLVIQSELLSARGRSSETNAPSDDQ